MRVFALSDLHVDFQENRTWIHALSSTDYTHDTLLVAGDVSHSPAEVEAAIEALLRKYANVWFTPGNHDVWLTDDQYRSSLEKYDALLDRCKRVGAEVEPGRAGDVWIVPLHSWYVKPEEGPDSLFTSRPGDDGDLSIWSDEHFVRWPGPESAAETLLARNVVRSYDAPVLSFSHFLPRPDLMFGLDAAGKPAPSRWPYRFNFSRVAGSKGIERQIRALGSRVHVHGHQHRNRRRWVDGVLYVSHSLGYPRERRNPFVRHVVDGPLLIWDEAGSPPAFTTSY